MEDYIQLQIPFLKSQLQKISVIIQSLTQYKNKDKLFKASEFLELITQIKNFQNPEDSMEDLSLFQNQQQQINLTLENLVNIGILQPKQQNFKNIALTLSKLAELDKQKYILFRGLVDSHLEIMKIQDINAQSKLLALTAQSWASVWRLYISLLDI
ncbi:UNKNOWN [Stylonychia lemnae]|uniref:Uncharacterized protein n=1 Tax=Stylonychia lemnae TaxID=5949 RepID=A0A078AEH9_STYLE|nr:UNKNOWN [Stylonychia lemnae]|eukprot:CDW80679.1 UNKNOWN [Stylonychia lemnae]